MKITVDGKYKKYVKAIMLLIPIFSIALSFLTLPTEAAVGVAVVSVVIPLILNKFVFKYSVLHVMPMPTDKFYYHSLGSSWFANDLETLDGLGLVLLFKYKETAQEVFHMFKAWNYGKVIDKSENIVLKAIREGNDKYSIYIYPGDRIDSLIQTKENFENNLGKDSQVNIKVAKFYFQLCFEYEGQDVKIKCVEGLPYVNELVLNVGYVESNEVKMFSKRGFRLKNYSLIDREDSSGAIENSVEWSDPYKNLPDVKLKTIQKVNKKLEQQP